MAGIGSRFYNAGYKLPKPFIDVKDKMMIEKVLDNLQYDNASYVLIAQKEHLEFYPEKIKKLQENYSVKIIGIEHITEGAACTVLAAREFINNDVPVLIANSDQIVDINISDFISHCFENHLDGSIMTFKNDDPKWSFVKINEDNLVVEAREKIPISNNATVGIYFFSRGSDFIDGTIDLIANNDKTNNEYYVCPVYNYLIKKGKRIGIYEIASNKMHGTGTPEDLRAYLKENIYTKATEVI